MPSHPTIPPTQVTSIFDPHEGCNRRIAELTAYIESLLKLMAEAAPTPTIIVNIDAAKREQIEALAKPLEWSNGTALGINGWYVDCGHNVIFEDMDGDPAWSSDRCDTPAKLKEAADTHHRQAVLSLLILPA